LFGDNITCGNDDNIYFGKPQPNLFLSVWKKFDSPPVKNSLVLEDSYNGVRAAKADGMHVSK
jgi:HAD superfamily hydrolase (TIGR01509 family)